MSTLPQAPVPQEVPHWVRGCGQGFQFQTPDQGLILVPG